MARIRTIKPEFFTSSDILALTPLARLFYVSLWCESDREGLLKWDPAALKFRYLPKDMVDIEQIAQELVEQGLINILVGDDGKEYAQIPSFKSHQIINNRESESILASRVKDASARVTGEGRKEGKGKDNDACASDAPASPSFNPKAELQSLGVTDQTAKDWLALRKSKRAVVTLTALTNIVTQANKAGVSLERALVLSCQRGWTGFEASWLKPEDLATTAAAVRDWI